MLRDGGILVDATRCAGMVGKAMMGDKEGEAVKTSDKAGESSPPDELCGICLCNHEPVQRVKRIFGENAGLVDKPKC